MHPRWYTDLNSINNFLRFLDDILDSVTEAGKGGISRPNYVSLFGLETAKNRLENFIERARSTLDEASLESEELHYLASILLNIDNRKEK